MGEDWWRIEEDLSEIARYYEEGNRLISLGQVGRLRREALAMGMSRPGMLLDAGCGPGNMSELALSMHPGSEVVMLDPLPEMLKLARLRVRSEAAHEVRAVYEDLPFRAGSFNIYVAGFSLRDALDRTAAVAEARRVLREGGNMLVLDLGKPDSSLRRSLIYAYWRFFVPFLLVVFMGRRGRAYRDIFLTVKKLPANRTMRSIFSHAFGTVRMEERLLGGVLLALASDGQAVEVGSISSGRLK